MPDQFRIVRYRAEDRERVLRFIGAVRSPQLAERLVRQWNWKYDANPFNREYAQYRRAHRQEVLAFNLKLYTPERFDKFCRKWGIDPDDGAGDEGPFILLMSR